MRSLNSLGGWWLVGVTDERGAVGLDGIVATAEGDKVLWGRDRAVGMRWRGRL